MPTHLQNRLTGLIRSGVNRGHRAIGEDTALHMAPEMVHGVQLRGRRGHKAEGNMQVLGQPATRGRRMGRPSILKEHDVPAPPMGANHREEGVLRRLVPGLRDIPHDIPAPDMQHPVQDAPGMGPGDRHRHLLAPGPIAVGEGRHLGDDGLIEPEEDRARAPVQPPLEPPFAWRHVAERWASR
jgi:hypothetical protein